MGRLTGGDPSLLRRINSAVVLHALRATDCATLTEITRVTGLSRPTVEGVVEGLIEAGLVVEKAAEEGAARRQGRPARRFRFRAEAGHLLGLEIGAHRVAALLADLDGRVIGAQAKDVSETAGTDERLERLRGAVAELLRRAGVARGSLRAVGVATPGIVEADGTVRLGTALPGWTGLRLGERLGRSFKCPVLVENDANAAAVAEHWKGAATESDDVVFVLAGLSPGAGALIGGGCTGDTAGRPARSARCICWAGRSPRRPCSPPPTNPCTRSTSRRSPRSSHRPARATGGPARPSTASSSDWSTTWRPSSSPSTRNWWSSAAGQRASTASWTPSAKNSPATACAPHRSPSPASATRRWPPAPCAWPWTTWRNNCSA